MERIMFFFDCVFIYWNFCLFFLFAVVCRICISLRRTCLSSCFFIGCSLVSPSFFLTPFFLLSLFACFCFFCFFYSGNLNRLFKNFSSLFNPFWCTTGAPASAVCATGPAYSFWVILCARLRHCCDTDLFCLFFVFYTLLFSFPHTVFLSLFSFSPSLCALSSLSRWHRSATTNVHTREHLRARHAGEPWDQETATELEISRILLNRCLYWCVLLFFFFFSFFLLFVKLSRCFFLFLLFCIFCIGHFFIFSFFRFFLLLIFSLSFFRRMLLRAHGQQNAARLHCIWPSLPSLSPTCSRFLSRSPKHSSASFLSFSLFFLFGFGCWCERRQQYPRWQSGTKGGALVVR